ncbi:MAG: sugar phosphate isomerase/epimerase [Armatimonadetes bacterium]|nr:sugar phosphate isomerase/epimerase [Armatimonadota bacterium]HPO74530.1 sugar phosphate isomerase/epimerase family protein [Armatimonadota bacterium]
MSDLRQSVMLFPFHKQLADGTLSPGDMLREFHEAGVTGLEPSVFRRSETPSWWGDLVSGAKDLGMEFACCVISCNLVGESEADRQAALDWVAQGVEISASLGCPTVLVAGSRPAPGMSNEEGRKVLAGALAKAAERAQGSGVTVTIEDFGVYPEFTCSSEHVLEVVQAAAHPNLKVTFDNGNFLFADDTPVQAFPRLKELIRHVHIKDFAPGEPGSGRRWVGTAIGSGQAMVRESLALVKGMEYKGWVSLEVSIAPPLPEAVQAAKVVRDLWAEV